MKELIEQVKALPDDAALKIYDVSGREWDHLDDLSGNGLKALAARYERLQKAAGDLVDLIDNLRGLQEEWDLDPPLTALRAELEGNEMPSNDITLCTNDTCELRHQCRRSVQKSDSEYQSSAYFSPVLLKLADTDFKVSCPWFLGPKALEGE